LKLRKVVFAEMNKLQGGESVKPGIECLLSTRINIGRILSI
jgi:hypothetical protein